MSHNISSSDSEEESHDSTMQQRKQKDPVRESRYECPADFMSFQYSCSEAAELGKRGENTELWLIKAPARFNNNSLADLKVSLSGLEMIQSNSTPPQIYSVLASRSAPADLRLLISGNVNRNAALCTSGFAGVLSISESYGDCSGNQNLLPIPAAPAPSIPPGLKQRFQPFGRSTDPHIFQHSTLASQSDLKRAHLELEESDDHRQKKKKKKKSKHSSKESTEVIAVKQEELSYDCSDSKLSDVTEDQWTTEIKKKKVKEEIQDEVTVDAGLIFKEEPKDSSYGDTGSLGKKKKKTVE